MANWCFNTVRFTGEPTAIQSVKDMFYDLARKEEETGRGQLPEFVASEEEGWFFDLGWTEGILVYTTRWNPNSHVLQTIAERYGLEFIHRFEESANRIYGRATYCLGKLTYHMVDLEDFDLYELNENIGAYVFEGGHYESSEDILEILLHRKTAIQNLTI